MSTTISVSMQVDITLESGLIGFPLARHFRLTQAEGGLYEMSCLDIPDMGFVVVAPSPFFPDYSPVIDPATAARIGLARPEDAVVLLLVNLGSDDEPPGANLLAPVVINIASKKAMQVVLEGQELPLRASFPTA